MKFNQGRYVWLASYIGVATFVCATSFLMCLFYDREIRAVEMENNRNMVRETLEEVSQEIEFTITQQANALQALGTYISLQPDIDRQAFYAYARRSFMRSKEFELVALAPDLVVSEVFPFEGNQAILGLDYKANPDLMIPINNAIEAKSVVIAGPIEVKFANNRRGLIARKAIYTTDFAAFGSRFWGIASLVLDVDEILEKLTALDDRFDVALRGKNGLGMDGGMIQGAPMVFAQDPVIVNVDLPNGNWVIAAVPKGGWLATGRSFWIERAVFIIGALVVTALIWGVMRLIQLRMRADVQLTTAINCIEDGFAFYDSDDRLVICNDKYREFYALSAEALVPGATFESIIRFGITHNQYPEAAGREEEFLKERLRAHRAANVEVEQQLSDGRWLQIKEARTPDGGTVGFRVDITELKNARDAAEAANQAKSEFLDVMSHELRTPLTVVLGGTPFLCRPEMLPAATKLFKTLEDQGEDAVEIKREVDALLTSLKSLAGKVERSAKHLLTLINDVLDFSKIDAGRMDLTRKRIDLASLVDDLVEEYSLKASAKGLSLEGDVGEIFVDADELRLRQVFINIIGNALKFTDEGGVKITADDRGAQVKISVTDTGCGIPEDRIDDVFNKFTQLDSSTARKAGGTGLGMAITKKIVEMHGGQISIKSKVGVGSVFTFTLHRAAQATDDAVASEDDQNIAQSA